MASATSPPVQDSAVATVRPLPIHACWSRSARATRAASAMAGLRPVRLDRGVRRLEQPGLGDADLAEGPELDAIQGEIRIARVAGPDLHRGLAGEEDLVAIV